MYNIYSVMSTCVKELNCPLHAITASSELVSGDFWSGGLLLTGKWLLVRMHCTNGTVSHGSIVILLSYKQAEKVSVRYWYIPRV